MIEARSESGGVLIDEHLSAFTLDLAPDPVFIYRAEERLRFRCVATNRAALTSTGFSEGEVVGKTLEEIVGPEEAALYVESFKAAMQEDALIRSERTVDLPAGRLTFQVTTAAIRDDEGYRTHIVTCSRNVTVERQAEVARQKHWEAEQARRQAERELTASFENAPIGMNLSSPDGRLLRVNSALCDMLGYREEQLLAMNWRDFTHPADIESDEAEVDRLVNSPRGTRAESVGLVEKRYVRADGSMIWVLLNMALIRDTAGDPSYFVTHIQDITERRRRDRALEEAEERFRTAFQYAPIGMALVTPQGRFSQVNAALCQMLGYSAEQLCELSIPQVIHPDDLEETRKALGVVLDGEAEALHLEKRIMAADGRTVSVVANATLVRDPEGQPLYFICQLVDVSDLYEANSRLRDLLRSKDELIASVSHELRTPLTGVIGFAEVLRDPNSGHSAAERQEMITAIATQGAELANIVEDLLTAAQVEGDTLNVAQVPVDLGAQAAQVIEGLDQQAVLPIELSASSVRAVGDPARVRQILRNLVTNALRYGGETTRIVIDQAGSSALIGVRDSGPGIPEAKRDVIFEPYQRAHHNDEGLTASVGLGLAVSRKLARLMNGDLTYHRQDGETVFQLTLPIAERWTSLATEAPRYDSV